MKKIITSSMLLVGMTLSGAIAFGQTDGVTPTVVVPMPVIQLQSAPTREILKSDREAMQENIKAALEKLQEERKAMQEKSGEVRTQLNAERVTAKQTIVAATSTEAVKAMREVIQQKAEQAREAAKTTREEFKDKMETAREEIKTKRETEMAALKTKLEAVKDARKKEAVERLDKRFDEINARLTSQWTDALARLEELLTKITSRADKAALSGADVSAVLTEVEKAKVAIAAARIAVKAQATKTYPISVTTEDALKSAVSQARELLNKDLQAVRSLMQAAYKGVTNSVIPLKAVPEVDKENGDATTTSATTTQ